MNILITGANRGLGLEMVKQSLAAGHSVIATAREPATATELHETDAQVLSLDVTDPTSVEALAMAVGKGGDGAVDVLINNAGAFPDRFTPSMFELTPEQLMETFRVNTMGPWLVTRAMAGCVARSERKLIVQISSLMGSQGKAAEDKGSAHLAYRSSKSALNMLNLLMANDLAERGITTVALHPGWVQTDMGGAEAPLAIPVAVGRILNTVHRVKPAQNGAFLDLDGKVLPW